MCNFSPIPRYLNHIIVVSSSNGTFINGILIGKKQKREIRDGDVIALAREPAEGATGKAARRPTLTFHATCVPHP